MCKEKEERGIPIDEFWEDDDGIRMDGLIRVERFIKSQGNKSAQIWKAWFDIKKIIKERQRIASRTSHNSDYEGAKFPKLPSADDIINCQPCLGTVNVNAVLAVIKAIGNFS